MRGIELAQLRNDGGQRVLNDVRSPFKSNDSSGALLFFLEGDVGDAAYVVVEALAPLVDHLSPMCYAHMLTRASSRLCPNVCQP